MLKENDGTDSALEWEEFGASGVGESGNTGRRGRDDDDRDVLPAAEGPALRALTAERLEKGRPKA